MREILFILTIISVVSLQAQTIWIADNNPNPPTGSNIFPTLQEAIDAAAAGDTIYVQPSNTTYGTATATVELHFRGIGFNLDKDIPYTSSVTALNLYGSSDGSSNPSNSTVSGLTIQTLRLSRESPSDPAYTLSGIRIFNNSITTLTFNSNSSAVDTEDFVFAFNYIFTMSLYGNFTATVIRNNVVDASISFLSSSSAINAIVANNIISGTVTKNSVDDFLVLQNNIFIGNGSSSRAFSSSLENTTVSNNIFFGATPSITSAGGSTSTSFENNVFSNNIAFNTGNDELPPSGGEFGNGNTGLGNLSGIDPNFTQATLSTAWESTDDFTTAAPEVTDGGSDGTDIGIFGGPYPFAPNLQLVTSAIPTIQSLNINALINPGQDLQVDITAKSN